MGGSLPKQYQPLAGKSLLERSLLILEQSASISGIAVVLAAQDKYWPTLKIQCSKPLRTIPGGAERADSVLAGLHSLADTLDQDDWVLIHDAARPCLLPDHIERMESALMGHACGGLLAIPLRDTLKQSDENGEVASTKNRDNLWLAQTPQIFRYGLLVDALAKAGAQGVQATDESMAMELAGHKPLLIEGRADNIKITVPEDIALAEYLLAKRSQSVETSGS